MKSKKSIEENTSKYEEYFKDDLEAIEEELEKSKEYSKIIDDQLSIFSAPGMAANKGGQHYLIEHITNAVQLQTQRQGLRRDRFAIKKAILDYASKFADEEENGDAIDISAAIEKLLKKDTKNNILEQSNLDETIDNILKDEDE